MATVTDYRKSFWTQIELVSRDSMGDFPTEENPKKFGNVEFWHDGENWCYSRPVVLWDVKAISADIVKGVEMWVKGKRG